VLELGSDDVVVIVGPNNSGKSATLRGIQDKLRNPANGNPVVGALRMSSEGSPEDFQSWLERTAHITAADTPNRAYHLSGAGVAAGSSRQLWAYAPSNGLGAILPMFCQLMNAEARLTAANPAQTIRFLDDPPATPIHHLYRDDDLAASLSAQFQRAFGVELVVHHSAGGEIPLMVGVRPEPAQGQDRLSKGYVEALERLDRLQQQGDGMRSFAGVLLSTAVGRESVMLVDEPEAFLHPPQARLIGQMLVTEKKTGRQLFVATHSGDVLRGVLDAGSPSTKIIRLTRNENQNVASILNPTEIAQLWNDPLLRYSNILDGLFHERVIVCESDADCRFYAAVADAHDAKGSKRPDQMFVHGGGKSRIHTIVGALARVAVPVRVICDFDVLREEEVLRRIVESMGGDFAEMQGDWQLVSRAIASQVPTTPADAVSEEIRDILAPLGSNAVTAHALDDIKRVLRRLPPWARAKELGVESIPDGEPRNACSRLLRCLASIRVFVVPNGELEGFARSIPTHGPSWVNAALKRDLRTDPELAEARRFVGDVIA